jgi:hypothetical protein
VHDGSISIQHQCIGAILRWLPEKRRPSMWTAAEIIRTGDDSGERRPGVPWPEAGRRGRATPHKCWPLRMPMMIRLAEPLSAAHRTCQSATRAQAATSPPRRSRRLQLVRARLPCTAAARCMNHMTDRSSEGNARNTPVAVKVADRVDGPADAGERVNGTLNTRLNAAEGTRATTTYGASPDHVVSAYTVCTNYT